MLGGCSLFSLGGYSLFSLWDTVHLRYGVQAVLIKERTVKRKNKDKRQLMVFKIYNHLQYYRFMYKLYRHKLYRHKLYRHNLYRHKLYRAQTVSGTNCIGHKLYRALIVSCNHFYPVFRIRIHIPQLSAYGSVCLCAKVHGGRRDQNKCGGECMYCTLHYS